MHHFLDAATIWLSLDLVGNIDIVHLLTIQHVVTDT